MARRKFQKNFTLARHLQFLMTRLGLNQEKMAQQVGVSQQTVSKWLRGAPPALANVEKLAEANGVSMGFFLDPWPDPKRHLFKHQKAIDIVSESANIVGVRPLLPGLLERLKSATKERGKKTALAKFLGVPLSNVSQYLAGDREPGGETTLKMLYWVEHPECQQ